MRDWKQMKSSFLNMELGGVSNAEIMLMTKHLAVGLKSGLTLVEGLEMVFDQQKGKMKHIIGEMLKIVESGKSFHEALQAYPKYFSTIYINMIKTGETTGTLEENLTRLAENLRKAHELRQKIASAMMYPTMILIAIMGLGLSVSIFVLPKIVPLFRTMQVELPFTTRVLLVISDITTAHPFLIGIGTPVACIFFIWFVRQKWMRPITHRAYLIIPIVSGITKNINLARFTRTLGVLLTSGMTLDMSLMIAVDATDNIVFRNTIFNLIAQIQKGTPLATVLAYTPKLFPPLVSRMVAMGERTGSLDNSLTYLSEYYENEVDTTVKNLSTILEPILLIGIGLIVGVVAISILSPIYQITGSIKK